MEKGTITAALRAFEAGAGTGSAGRSAIARAVVGFDGFVDTMFSVVRERGPNGAQPFQTIAEFAAHVGKAAGQSADMELVHLATRAGGNAPLLANALSSLGVATTCAGALGWPSLRPVFSALHPGCELLSVCEPADTSAYEFRDGKLMFADLAPLDGLDWAMVRERADEALLAERLAAARIVALVDWGALRGAQEIWEHVAGLLEESAPRPSEGTRGRLVFVDLADISKRTPGDIEALVAVLRRMARSSEVTLGLNEHEAWTLDQRLEGDRTARAGRHGTEPLDDVCRRLYDLLQLPVLVVHPVDRSYAVSAAGLVEEKGRVVTPLLSTGGGDNFNAGWCLGRSLGLDYRSCLVLGMTVSRLYVSTGRSPGVQEVIAELERSEAG